MGALVSRALRPIKSFNIENRAHRVISKEKPTPAPKYSANLEDLRRALEAEPDLDDKLQRKDTGLDERLKNVYVTSSGRPEEDLTREVREKNPNRPLPKNRLTPEQYELGYKEPDKITYGRTSLRKAMEFISAHQADPAQITVPKIAFEYKLKEEDVANTVKYFKTFEMYLPATKNAPASFAGPASYRALNKDNLQVLQAPSSAATSTGENKKDANFDSELKPVQQKS